MNKPLVITAPQAFKDHSDFIYRLSLFLLFFTALFLLPAEARAENPGDPLSATLCIVVNWFKGDLGRFIATLAIIVLGIGALMGKVSWQLAIIVTIGISIMFGSERIVYLLTKKDLARSVCQNITGPTAGMLQDVLCRLAELASKPTGRALATVGVLILGIGALMGKVSWGMALTVVMGIALLFGAPAIGANIIGAVTGTTPGNALRCSP